jgi:hypothetical protein
MNIVIRNDYALFLYRTRQRTSIESLINVQASFSSIDILRRICEQCAITDIEYFDPVLCDGVKSRKKPITVLFFSNFRLMNY